MLDKEIVGFLIPMHTIGLYFLCYVIWLTIIQLSDHALYYFQKARINFFWFFTITWITIYIISIRINEERITLKYHWETLFVNMRSLRILIILTRLMSLIPNSEIPNGCPLDANCRSGHRGEHELVNLNSWMKGGIIDLLRKEVYKIPFSLSFNSVIAGSLNSPKMFK